MTQAAIPLIAETTGTLWKIVAQPGTPQSRGAELFILESMKMEIAVEAEMDGAIEAYLVEQGEPVTEGQVIAHFIPR